MIQMVIAARKEKLPDKSGSISVSLVSSTTDLDRTGMYKEVHNEGEALALAEARGLEIKFPSAGPCNDEADTPVGTFCTSPNQKSLQLGEVS